MITIDNEALEIAKESVDKACKEYEEKGERDALHRYLEALEAYRTLITVRYNLR